MRTGRVDTGGTTRFDRRHDLLGVFRPEQAVLAGVRVDAANGDARLIEEAMQRLVGQLDDLDHTLRGHPANRLGQ